MRSSGWRIGAVALAAVVVAEAAVLLLRPRETAIEPVKVAEREHFSPAYLERARDYRSGQRSLFFAGLAVEGGVLVLLVAGRPRRVRELLERSGSRPLAGAASVGAGISLGLALAGAPLEAWAHSRAVGVGVSTQDWAGWLSDAVKSSAIGAGMAGAGAALLISAVRRSPRRWWLAASAGVVAFEIVFVWLAPVLLAPRFNRFEPLPQGELRGEVLGLADRAGVEVGEVYRIDASRRTRALNAYVDGIGPTRRVVLYDTLLDDVERGELRSVLAHEFAHVRNRDVPRGMLWVALSAPLAMLAVQLGSVALARHRGTDPRSPAFLAPVALCLAVAVSVGGVAGARLSRAVEARADSFALALTENPDAFIALQKRLVERSLADPDPPAVFRALFATHPPAMERIGAAEAWKRGARGSG